MQLVDDGEPSRFVQIWVSEGTGEWVRREGVLGRTGRITELGLAADASSAAELAAPYLADGFAEVDDEFRAWIVVQYPTRDKRSDERLIDHASEWLAAVLDERGLGYVDGYDRGRRGGDGRLVVNLYARVVDAGAGCEAAMAALRRGRADERRATIAHRPPDGEEWTVRYARTSGKLPGDFSI
ncbi:hypothetical protein RB608_05345 [Nocardioides sp. LHD-245]|uniref:hypothetical protein n=1 Tax=Nocardioides sp. LHD-245 TaxID=3051387 RepID=UPI0027E20F2F|nr:hypothetical protein [Nocardioides sp. LHD-245]